MTKKNWVNYKTIKASVTIEQILRHYGVWDNLKPSGRSMIGCCPIHQGTNPRQFSVNPEKNIFNCFGDCQGGGNIIDLVAKMEKCDTKEAAKKIQNWFLGPAHNSPIQKTRDPGNAATKKDTQLVREKKEPPAPDPPQDAPVNPPLTFRLQTVPEHQFFVDRCFNQETVNHFGLGFCARGMMADRVAIPIENVSGELVAYCGRGVTPDQIESEKYKLPPGFNKSLVVYNLSRQPPGIKTLVVVESFLSVFRLYQAGINQVVAYMGSSMSDKQEDLIADFLGPAGQVILLLDADDAGNKGSDNCLARLSSKLFVKNLDISPLAKKPHLASEEDLKKLFAPYI
ncbi:MAG TPA: CHC2 zinc finger domain-containing protein [Desulfatiglandales bacterium]|nr:CHC2 zinc finger domain-containing protein [Desulfatiglandales bacterium]